MASDDVLEINCPKCKKIHRYALEVHRSWVMEHFSLSSGQPRYHQFTRLFTCPVKGKDFEVSFSLVETSGSLIETVDVLGVVQDGNDNQ